MAVTNEGDRRRARRAEGARVQAALEAEDALLNERVDEEERLRALRDGGQEAPDDHLADLEERLARNAAELHQADSDS